MRNLQKTLLVTFISSILVVGAVATIQILSQKEIVSSCSYLDPITIDFLAFIAAAFLVIEGFVRIAEHPKDTLKNQVTRIIRICFGFAIITLFTKRPFSETIRAPASTALVTAATSPVTLKKAFPPNAIARRSSTS